MSLSEVYYGGIEPSHVKGQESAIAFSRAHALLGEALQGLTDVNSDTNVLGEPIAHFREAQERIVELIKHLQAVPGILNPYVTSIDFPELSPIQADYIESTPATPSPKAGQIDNDLTLYTIVPRVPSAYSGGVYRHVVGVQYQEPTVWLPNVAQNKTEAMRFAVPPTLGRNIREYFRDYYVNNPGRYRNCHVGASAMAGAGYQHPMEAGSDALAIMEAGRSTSSHTLDVAEWGVYGVYIAEPENIPHSAHSLIGLAPGLGIQTDSENGPLSVVSHTHNLEHYRQIDNQPNLQLYRQAR